MDPMIIARVAHIRQQEFIEQAQFDDPRWLGQVWERLGSLLVALGERMQASAAPRESGCPDMAMENC